MLVESLLVVGGLAVLVAGGEALVRGASGIALLARMSPAVVGLTIVAAGTSMPELVVSFRAALEGSSGLAVGNVVGSNCFNIAAILGLTALIRPLTIQGNTVRLEWPVMFLATLELYLLARDGEIDRMEGGFLVTALVVFIAYAVVVARSHVTGVEQRELSATVEQTTASLGRAGRAALALNVIAVVIGCGLLAGGASLLVDGATGIARALGVSETVIGLTIVAAGTSTPELVTSLVAAWRNNHDIAVSNIIGSNIFNILGIAGATALIKPLSVPAEIIARDAPWMIAFTLLLLPLMKTGMRIQRVEGAVLLGGFLVYLTSLF